MILVLLAYFFLSSTFVIAKAAMAYAQPIFLIGVRMTLAGLMLYGYVYFFNDRQWKIRKNDLWLFIQMAVLYYYLSFVLEFWTYPYVSASKVAFLFNLSPFITALFAYICLSEVMTMRKWIGLIVAFIGSLPMLTVQNTPAELSAGKFLFFSLPEISLLLAVITGAYGFIVMSKLVVRKNYSPILINAFGMFFGGIAAFITSFLAEKKPLLKCASGSMNLDAHGVQVAPPWFCFSWPDFAMFMGCVLLLILVANIIFYNSYGFLLKKYTPTFLSLVGLVVPALTAFLAWIFLGEKVTWVFFLSLAVVLTGAYIFYKDELKAQGVIEE